MTDYISMKFESKGQGKGILIFKAEIEYLNSQPDILSFWEHCFGTDYLTAENKEEGIYRTITITTGLTKIIEYLRLIEPSLELTEHGTLKEQLGIFYTENN